MKRFKSIKPLQNFEGSKLTTEQMQLTKGGLMSRIIVKSPTGCTSGTRSICHIDGTTDCDYAY